MIKKGYLKNFHNEMASTGTSSPVIPIPESQWLVQTDIHNVMNYLLELLL
jgi:hypothetical protein